MNHVPCRHIFSSPFLQSGWQVPSSSIVQEFSNCWVNIFFPNHWFSCTMVTSVHFSQMKHPLLQVGDVARCSRQEVHFPGWPLRVSCILFLSQQLSLNKGHFWIRWMEKRAVVWLYGNPKCSYEIAIIWGKKEENKAHTVKLPPLADWSHHCCSSLGSTYAKDISSSPSVWSG